jgi:hypothetical protein
LGFGSWFLSSLWGLRVFSFLFCFFACSCWFRFYTSCMLRDALRFFNIFLCLPIYIYIYIYFGSLEGGGTLTQLVVCEAH